MSLNNNDIQKQETDSLQVAVNDNKSESEDEIRRLSIRLQEFEVLAEKRTQELNHFTAYDKLTGLPTRTLFYDRFAPPVVIFSVPAQPLRAASG